MTPFDSKHFDTVCIYKTGILKSAVPLRKVLLLCICFIELTWTLDGDELYQCCPHCYKLKCLLQKRFIVSNKFTLPLNHLLAASLSGAQLSLSCIIRGTHGFKPLWRHHFFYLFFLSWLKHLMSHKGTINFQVSAQPSSESVHWAHWPEAKG